jgi:NADH-dependent peroxiredoxin subunit C
MISIGDTIQNISFEAYQNGEVKNMKLEDFRGKWLILLFYPADFTFVCPTELKEAADLYPEFKKEDAEIVSISTDTVFVHKAWHDNSDAIKSVTFPMAADPCAKLCKAFGTYIENEGLSLRGSFVIDPDGVLKAYEIHDNSIGRSSAELLRKVRAAKFVAEHGGEVCPASWKPGEATLKPSLDLVGEI